MLLGFNFLNFTQNWNFDILRFQEKILKNFNYNNKYLQISKSLNMSKFDKIFFENEKRILISIEKIVEAGNPLIFLLAASKFSFIFNKYIYNI